MHVLYGPVEEPSMQAGKAPIPGCASEFQVFQGSGRSVWGVLELTSGRFWEST